MDAQDSKSTDAVKDQMNYYRPRSGRIFGGLIILAAGMVMLLKQLGAVAFPAWLFTWPMFLIVFGLYLGVRHGLRGGGWIIILLIGGIFLTQEFYPNMNIWEYVFPILIIAFGLIMILRPKQRWDWRTRAYWEGKIGKWEKYRYKYGQTNPAGSSSSNDYIDSVSIFGGVHKVVVSKDFKGGDIVNMFGGAEINLSQADIKGKITLDVVQIFGGSKIIVPADWTLQPRMVSIFGGIEDKRNPALLKPDPEKVLVLEGVSIFAGIEILSY